MSTLTSNLPEPSAPQVLIQQEVGENLGRVIGVQTDAIHGDVYGGDIYEVQVYVLGNTAEPGRWRRFLDADPPPYKFLAPYSIQDRLLFKGREREIEQVVRQIGQQQVTVLYGANGVGKTSLLSAGVMPNLISYGALVLQIQDYHQPAEAICKSLLANAQLDLALAEATTLPELVQAIYANTHGSLILVLDQFEQLFDPSIGDAEQAAFLDALTQSLQAVQPDYFRLVISIQEGALGRLEMLRSRLLDVGQQPFIRLDGLDREQARAAIEEPLQELKYPVSFVGNLVADRLVPDLDDLTPAAPGIIQPVQLQIVCTWLYQEACPRRPPHIDLPLYRAAKGAEGILSHHLHEILKTWLAEEHETAAQILELMANPATETWVSPEELSLDGTSPQQIVEILETLTRARILFRRSSNGHATYAFSSGSVVQEIRRLGGPEAQRRYHAEAEVERVWAAWLARDAFATRNQLHYLAVADDALSLQPLQALLLLRSAVARFEPTTGWLRHLRSQDGVALIQQLEAPQAIGADQRASDSRIDQAALLLGMDPAGEEETEERPFGALATVAVDHPEPVIRQTAALALTALGSYQALDRLNWALRSRLQGWRRRVRQAELQAALADGDPEFVKKQADLSLLDRTWIWWLRIQQQVIRHRHTLIESALGGAIGAGLGLGLLRGLWKLLGVNSQFTGAEFAVNFFSGAILGAALVLGVQLSVLLFSIDKKEERRSLWRLPVNSVQLLPLLAVSMGTLFFAMAHVFIVWFNGGKLLNGVFTLPAALIAGFALSIAIHDQPQAGWPKGWGKWIRRIGFSVCFFTLAQAIFWLTGVNRHLAVIRMGRAYVANFSNRLEEEVWWQTIENSHLWLNIFTLIDAALVGLVLALGLIVGLLLMTKWMARWRLLVEPD